MATKTRFQPPSRLTPRSVGLALAVLALSAWTPGNGATSAASHHVDVPAGGPAAAPGGAAVAPKGARQQAVGCLIGPERMADIGTPVTGVIASIKVDRGDMVKQGETLVVLDSAVEQAGVHAAQSRASIDADIRAAEANVTLTEQKYRRVEGLVGEGFVTAQAVEQARAERDVAEQKLAQARAQRVVQTQELGIVRAQLGQRTLRAPFAGVIAERFVNAGERAEDKPLLRVAMLDPLRVELVVPAARWGSIAKGDQLPIVPELPGAGAMLARVSHVDKIIDAASNTFRVRLALPNPGHKLPAGARCKLDGPNGTPNPAPGASPNAAPSAAAAAQVLPTATRLPADAAARRPRLKITI